MKFYSISIYGRMVATSDSKNMILAYILQRNPSPARKEPIKVKKMSSKEYMNSDDDLFLMVEPYSGYIVNVYDIRACEESDLGCSKVVKKIWAMMERKGYDPYCNLYRIGFEKYLKKFSKKKQEKVLEKHCRNMKFISEFTFATLVEEREMIESYNGCLY